MSFSVNFLSSLFGRGVSCHLLASVPVRLLSIVFKLGEAVRLQNWRKSIESFVDVMVLV